MKLTNILIGIVVCSMITAGFLIFASSSAETYNAVGYENSSLERITAQQYAVIGNTTNAQQDLYSINATNNPLNQLFRIIDYYFTQAFNSIKLVIGSVFSLNTMTNEVINNIPATGSYAQVLSTGIGAIILIIIVVGILIYTLTKSERIS